MATSAFWWPPLSAWIDATLVLHRVADGQSPVESHAHPLSSHVAGGHGHSLAAHAESSLELTQQARRNLGLTDEFLRPVELATYKRAITVPAVVVPKPGRSQIIVASPLNGIVTHVHAVTGEAVLPGELLMEVRLTYEDLVETQTQYLKTISELDVENREIRRLETATQSGAISGRVLLDRRYAKEKLEALLRSQREALRMHGLSERQVDAIGADGRLLQELKVVAPDIDRHDVDEELRLSQIPASPARFVAAVVSKAPLPDEPKLLVVDDLQVHKGQAVVAGEKLCSLSDYSQLYIEGKAFEIDAEAVSQAAERGWAVDAILSNSTAGERIENLRLVFVANAIDADSRTLSIFVELPNEITRDETNESGQRYISWKYRLGQRLELQVPVEFWVEQIVLPVDAVVSDGLDWFVFKQHETHFDRVAVHVRHRDQSNVVIANDGSIGSGDVVAMKAAHQMQMAIRNRSVGGADPHAGHSH